MKARSKKSLINFNAYWDVLKAVQLRQGLKKGEWFNKSGIDYQRYSEFDKKTRDISARYFVKLCEGLKLIPDDIERMSGKKFSEPQKQKLRFEALVDANHELIETILSDPEKLRMCKKLFLEK